MAELRNKTDVFRRIRQDFMQCREARGRLRIFLNKELDKYRRMYSFMQDATVLEYLTFVVGQSAEMQMQELKDPVPSDGKFWRAVFDYDPFKLAPNTHSDLHRYLRMKNLASVPLGLYGGYAKLELVRRVGALPNTETVRNLTELEYAATDSGAISYPDAHPSELVDEKSFRVKDSQDSRLRRFTSLGSVIHVRPDGSWEYTGHALVVDMGEGRGRHPWLVLASEWERASENAEGSFFDHAPAQVAIDDENQPGVLPGGKNRTVVGMIQPMVKSELNILQQFGDDFNFVVRRDPPARAYHPDNPARGPDLAHVMSWYWDPVREVEVCYYKDGKEYMTYDRETKVYTYPSLEKHRNSVAGEFGMFGQLASLEPGGCRSEEDIPTDEDMGPPVQERRISRGGMSSSETTY